MNMLKITSLCRLSAVAGLLGVAVLSLSTSAAALPTPVYGKPTPPIVPEGQDGELDHTFGSNDNDGVDGFVDLGSTVAQLVFFLGLPTVQQSDGKILTAPLSAQPIFQSSIQRQNFDGSTDTTFGVDGLASLEIGDGRNTVVTSMALQPDGKILVAGGSYDSSPLNDPLVESNVDAQVAPGLFETPASPFVLRLLVNGTLDTSFGDHGVISYELPSLVEGYATQVIVQHDGKIVIAGKFATLDIELGSSRDFVMRFLADGELDQSFADEGIRIGIDLLTPAQWIHKIFQQPDGRLVLFGSRFGSEEEGHSAYLFRLETDGALDINYGTNGFLDLPFAAYSLGLQQAVMQPDNKIVTGRFVVMPVDADAPPIFHTELLRVTADGILDSTFGENGIVKIGDDNESWQLFGLALQPDGKLVAAGAVTANTNYPENSTLAVIRFLEDGTLDFSFGEDGVVLFDLIRGTFGSNVLIQPNGQILIHGFQINNSASVQSQFLVRLNSAKPVSVNGVTPSRLFDTRVGSPQGTIVVDKTTYGGSKELRVKVSGMSGLPEYGIGAATINLTATEPDDTGYITVYPCGTRPLASNMNYVADQTVSTSVTTAVSPTGEICVYSSAQTNLIADINSWSAINAGYAPLTPQRLVDTRARSPQGAITVVKKKYGTDSELRVKVAGAAGLPGARMSSVSLNVTVTEPETEGFITVYPCGTRPLASHLNFVADQTISASVTSPVSADGEICIYSSSPTNLIADTFGWFVQGSGITPVGPTRLVDTRSASPQGAISVTQKKYGATDELRLPLNNVAGLPDDGIGTVQLTVTATNPSDTGFITVYPCGTLPLASHLNYTTGQTIAASVTTQVSADGEICVHSNQPTNIIIDINGWGNQPQPQYQCNNIATLPEQNNTAVC
jgi:uncharacterized delta-60 repeat protein